MTTNSFQKNTGRVGIRQRANIINIRRRHISDITDLSGIAVMVTGATSFIGYPLCQDLVNFGYKVYGTMGAKNHSLTIPVVKYQTIDIDNKTDWDDYFKRQKRTPDVIVHLEEISEVGNKKDNYLFKKVNRDATANLACVAAKVGVKHFIYLSTTRVNGESSKGRKFAAGDTPDPKTAYAVSKWEAEEQLKNICVASGMDYTILRAPTIYGANVTGALLALLKEIVKEPKIPYVDEKNIRNLLYVRNLNSAIMFSMFNKKAKNRVFMIKDEDNFRVTEIIYRLAELMDKKVRMIKVPLSGLKFATYMRLSSHNWMTNPLEIDDSDIIKAGWKSKHSTFTGFSEMIEWFLITHKEEKKRRFFIR